MGKIINRLQQLGLSPHEARVYMKSLKKENNSLLDIEKQTRLHRPQIYQALERLEKLGLIHTITKGRRKQYRAASPQKLEELFLRKEKEFFNTIEDLHTTYEKSRSHKPEVTFSEGHEAIEKTYTDIVDTLEKDKKYYRYLSLSQPSYSKYVPRRYREKRDKKGLERLIITGKGRLHAKSNHLTRTVKTVPESFDLFEYEMSMTMYNDKVVLVDFDTESVIEIKHHRFAKFQKKVFKLLFSKL